MKLLDPFRIREVELRNRIVVSPMCQYSAKDGHPQTWHLVHLGSRAVGGAALVMAEATAVEARGRISPSDTGIYDDSHSKSWRPIAEFIRSQGALPGIQLAHAGRKASVTPPWEGGKAITLEDGGWVTVAPSAIAFDDGFAVPEALKANAIGDVVKAFSNAAARALSVGFEVLEIHAAHGYLFASHYRWFKPCEKSGRKSCLSLCGCPPRTGKKAAGMWSRRWNSRES
jgi:2,4-dienoyl-CoA reductase-like NADH-dependent reductase (Old Yellow Enzyme family)